MDTPNSLPTGTGRVPTPTLDRVTYPCDLRNFSTEQLRAVADELRAETVDAVSVTGGHLGASLGVVASSPSPCMPCSTPPTTG